jgi:hypothetical protein
MNHHRQQALLEFLSTCSNKHGQHVVFSSSFAANRHAAFLEAAFAPVFINIRRISSSSALRSSSK